MTGLVLTLCTMFTRRSLGVGRRYALCAMLHGRANFFRDDTGCHFFLGSLDVSLFSLLTRDRVFNLRFPNLDLFSRDKYHFAIAPDGNRNSISAMFGDRFSHSLAKCFFGFVCQKERRSFPLFHWSTLNVIKMLKRSRSSISIFPDSSIAIIRGISPELSKITHEFASGL